MHNPSHPGKVLKEWIPADLTVINAAKQLKVSRPVFSKILNGRSDISVNMALRLSAWLATSPDLWLDMQRQWNLWQAKKIRILKIKRLVVNGKKA